MKKWENGLPQWVIESGKVFTKGIKQETASLSFKKRQAGFAQLAPAAGLEPARVSSVAS